MSTVAIVQTDKAKSPTANPGYLAYLDPLGVDLPGDEVVTTTRRAISRVALVAVETAGRFQREEVPYDPMTWMLAPRDLFGGVNALEACLDRDACLRGILLHGLSLGLDADPILIDDLAADEPLHLVADETVEEDTASAVDAGRFPSNVFQIPNASERELQLFTATVVASDGCETVQAFHASLAADEIEFACRLQDRLGSTSLDARIVNGFDPSDPLVAALVSEVMCDTLGLIAADPSSPLAAGIDLYIEQRFYN